MEAKYLETKDAALYLCVKRSQLYRWAKNGDIGYYQPGRKMLFEISELEAFIKRSKRGGTNEATLTV